MKRIAGLIEASYIRAFNEFKRDRPNFEFAIDLALLPEYFTVPGGYHESALIVSLFNAMLSGKKQTKLFNSWAEMCKDDGNLGMFFLFIILLQGNDQNLCMTFYPGVKLVSSFLFSSQILH